MKQIFSAVAYLLQQDVVHRDLKPQNIVFSDKSHTKLKIIDFGLSGVIDTPECKSYMREKCGTILYMAPE